MNGLNVYVQMSEAQPQLSGITVRQTPEGIRFHQFTDRGVAILGSTATQIIMHYKRTLCDAPFNFHPFYYIFVERGWGANLSLAQIINFEFLPERAGKLDGIGTNFIATWPRLTVGSKPPAPAPATTTATAVETVETPATPAPASVPRPYTYALDDELDEAYSVEAQRSFMHGLDVYVQMSKSQPQLGGITLHQTPDGLRFHYYSHSGTATQMVTHYKRTLCDAPFNFHPLYYIFVERGRYANKSLAQIIFGGMVPGLAGKRMDVPDTYEATWPAVPGSATATATPVTVEETTPIVATATAEEPEVVLNRLRAKYTVLAEEHQTLIMIEAQLLLNQQLRDEIAHKRKVLKDPECQ